MFNHIDKFIFSKINLYSVYIGELTTIGRMIGVVGLAEGKRYERRLRKIMLCMF